MEFTINEIVGEDTTFTFTKDGITETLTVAGFPVSGTLDDMKAAIAQHVDAYLRGKQAKITEVSEDVQNVIGSSITL